MVKTFHPYVRMVYDTDRAMSEFDNIPRLQLYELPDECYKEGKRFVNSDLVSLVRSSEVKEVFSALKNARKYVMAKYPEILCVDVLFEYPKDIKEKIKEKSRNNEAVIDVAHRKDPGDRLSDRRGQAFFEVYIGPKNNPRVDCRLTNEGERKRIYQEIDEKVESALRDYLRILKEGGVKVKPGTSYSNLFEIVENF